ncbi:hypothetical protein E6W39_10965 [Kitasatospora acidiphila]|uniref:Uncharacterized protein n=1 Tax=Kitasatospora acidiphila TaxID=2567942 RepID=A0A540W0Y4_9ACTN|nr:hypothetical protein [Kitasatospora acidiphila]TQF02685.1 hypothetical protein E6W39_10965 [Kitasatospora acidiphila]
MTAADLPMLLPPEMVPEPGALNVSTFAKPEYAKLTFTYGRVKSGGSWPVHCKWFRVRIPTGRQASALTSEPTLIRYELTVPDGKRQWAVVPDTRDPNQVVFTCSPPPNEPAAFDGTWSVQLELWGIEVNGGAGPVDIIWEESTSATGADGPFQERTGKGGVSKRDDSFYLHSFRPASVAIGRNTKATLNWEGTPHATYTMYYRKPDGTQGSSTAKDGTWTSPENLVDDSSFTLEAKMGNEVRYLTTYIKVNNPDVAVTSVAAATSDGSVSVKNTLSFQGQAGLTIPQNGGQITVYGALTATAGPAVAQGALTANGPLTANSTITAKGNVTIEAGKTLTANGSITVDPGANGYIWLKTGRLDIKDTANLNVYGTLAVTKIKSTVNGAFAVENSINQTAGSISTTGNITAGGNRVLRAGDTLRFVSHKNRYLQEGPDYGGEKEVAQTSRTLYNNARWRTQHLSSASSFVETEDDRGLLEDPKADHADTDAEV